MRRFLTEIGLSSRGRELNVKAVSRCAFPDMGSPGRRMRASYLWETRESWRDGHRRRTDDEHAAYGGSTPITIFAVSCMEIFLAAGMAAMELANAR